MLLQRLVPLLFGMGPFLGKQLAVGRGGPAEWGSLGPPAGLASSAGSAGSEELRGQGGSRLALSLPPGPMAAPQGLWHPQQGAGGGVETDSCVGQAGWGCKR